MPSITTVQVAPFGHMSQSDRQRHDTLPRKARGMGRRLVNTYAVLFADPAGVVEVPGPGETEGAAVEVSIREHVGQAECVEIVFR